MACMPNTSPVNDDAGVTRLILARAAAARMARVYPIGAVTQGQAGERLAEIGELRAAGCVAVSDDGKPVANALVMRRALEYAAMFDMPVIDHCEDAALTEGGVAHEGYQAAALGLRGLPSAAEEIAVQRGRHPQRAHRLAGAYRASQHTRRAARGACRKGPGRPGHLRGDAPSSHLDR